MSELVIHACDYGDPKVLCGQLKMRSHDRKAGLRYTSIINDVTCKKCLRKLENPVTPLEENQ